MDEYKIITFKDGDKEMEILFSKNENTAWLTTQQIADLYRLSRQAISWQIKQLQLPQNQENKDGLNFAQLSRFICTTSKKKIIHYNLQVLLLIGERIKSTKGLMLKEYVDNIIIETPSDIQIDGNELVTYSNNGINFNVNLSRKEETIWLSQSQICKLFMTSQSNVSEHISAILQDKELDENSVYRYFRYTAKDGKSYSVGFYNLDMVLAVGYRVRSSKAIEFRKWATSKLKEYIYTGQITGNNNSLVVRDEFNHLYDFVNEMNKRLMEVEKNQKEETLDKIIVEDSRFDALVMMDSLISKANEIIILIDGYVDLYTLDMFKNKKKGVRLVIATNEHHYKLSEKNIELFKNQCGEAVIIFDNKVHDRFLIIDHKRYYHLGASMNYYGKYMSQITEETKESNIKILKERIDSYNI